MGAPCRWAWRSFMRQRSDAIRRRSEKRLRNRLTWDME
ncbi:hypothetical protein BACCAP_04244 [Pseudoflavonifractor capillosus ATCC 29799]|uniref:Uncharacterized protein n=1 Tax=Pseudoflavonifractor capillosus ATCC 29799 TaxID=411467 RepID=A6P177_9FIRM|nr:hypothetical protein BACCAP_04244 [Pseudoflavonifractor capillosus ATCC 29799]